MFRKLVSLREAEEIFHQHFKFQPLGDERIPLINAQNRILAENVVASLNIPPFDRSTVDGYAVRAKNTFGAEEGKPIELKLSGSVNIGELSKITLRDECVAEIVTGAPIPKGSDSVVMVENTELHDDTLKVFTAVNRFENVMRAGSDIRKGETALKKGDLLRSRQIGVLAALGLSEVNVHRIPAVAVLSTGGELTEPGKKLTEGKIYDINAYALAAAVLESGGKPISLGVVLDEPDKLKKALKEALIKADVVITSGGVSVGPKDILPRTVASLGKPGILFSGIATKPGKPATAASVNGKLVLSLPGHPTSALLVFHLIARPILYALAGRKSQEASIVKARLSLKVFAAKGRRTFVMVKVRREQEGLIAEPVETGQSGAITTLAKADGYVEIRENQQFIDVDEEVAVHLF